MQQQTEVITVFGNPVKMSISRDRCIAAFKQLMQAEEHPELLQVNGNTKSRAKQVRHSTYSQRTAA